MSVPSTVRVHRSRLRRGSAAVVLASGLVLSGTSPAFNNFGTIYVVNGRTFEVDLRHRSWPLPFRVRLDRFVHERHPGTNMDSRFSSYASFDFFASALIVWSAASKTLSAIQTAWSNFDLMSRSVGSISLRSFWRAALSA